MFRLRTLAIAGCILAASAASVRAQENDELKAILKKAIAAHGGEKNLVKYAGVISKFKGTIEIMGKARDISGETTVMHPDKVKHVMTLDIEGMQIPVSVVYDGKKMWRSVNNKTDEVKDEKTLSEIRETLKAEAAGSLVDYLKAPYELAALGEVKIKDQPAVGIRVSKKGQRRRQLFLRQEDPHARQNRDARNDEQAGRKSTRKDITPATATPTASRPPLASSCIRTARISSTSKSPNRRSTKSSKIRTSRCPERKSSRKE